MSKNGMFADVLKLYMKKMPEFVHACPYRIGPLKVDNLIETVESKKESFQVIPRGDYQFKLLSFTDEDDRVLDLSWQYTMKSDEVTEM